MCSFKHAHICINIKSKMCSKRPLFKEQRNSMTASKIFIFDFFKIAENVWFLIFNSHDKQCWIANKAQFNTQILGENKTYSCCAQGRNEVRWHPGKETSLEPPYSNQKSLGSKSAVEKSTCDIFRSFWRPSSDSAPHNDSAPGELRPPCPLSLCLWLCWNHRCFSTDENFKRSLHLFTLIFIPSW